MMMGVWSDLIWAVGLRVCIEQPQWHAYMLIVVVVRKS
jgi:hypothetical protein